MNRPIPSLLLLLGQKPLYKSKCAICSFILMKIKSFSCETFCSSTRSEKEANTNSEVELNSSGKCTKWPIRRAYGNGKGNGAGTGTSEAVTDNSFASKTFHLDTLYSFSYCIRFLIVFLSLLFDRGKIYL